MTAPELPIRLGEALRRSPFWGEKTRESDKTIQSLVCPECGKAEAWAYRERPFSINCNRANECGARTKTLELFPEVLARIERDHPATEDDPQRPARAFLQSRGLSESTVGLDYEYWRDVRGTGSGAVMFPVSRPDGETSWNGRLFNPPRGTGKTHNKGTTKGAVWLHPGRDCDPAAETFVTEGVIDALSLWEMGVQAVAVLASGQDPEAADLSAFTRLVFAFDADEAGKRALRRWGNVFPGSGAAVPPPGSDWNDLLMRWGPDAAERFRSARTEFSFNADLALAQTAEDYARTWEHHKNAPAGLFDFDGRTWYAGEKGVAMAGEFILSVDHYQKIETGEDREYRYRLRVHPHRGRPVRFTATAAEISTRQGLCKTLIQRARTIWTGSEPATNALLRKITRTEAPVIRQLDRIGLDRETGCAVFPSFLIDPAGNVRDLEPGGDHFRIGRRYLRPARAGEETVPPRGTVPPRELYRMMTGSWGERAEAAFAWTVASWFVDLVKPRANGFPFLSLFGDPQTGKSVMTRRLSNCQGFAREGVPMTGSTTKSFNRHLSKRSGLFLALLEESQTKRSRFNYDALLNAFTNDDIEHRARYSNDNQTFTLEFQGTILFVQNVEPFTSRAVRERVVSLEFRRDQLDADTESAFEELIQVPPEAFAALYPFFASRRREIAERWGADYERAKADMAGDIPDPRIRSNHAIILAFQRIVRETMGISGADLRPYLAECGRRKIAVCESSENPIADLFFETVLDAADEGRADRYADLRPDENRLYIRMGEACSAMRDQMGLSPKDVTEALCNHPAAKRSNIAHRFKLPDGGNPVKKCAEFALDLIPAYSCKEEHEDG
ncbi:MAG: toprim domain-containing protein [Desulfococcaceae bacterium]